MSDLEKEAPAILAKVEGITFKNKGKDHRDIYATMDISTETETELVLPFFDNIEIGATFTIDIIKSDGELVQENYSFWGKVEKITAKKSAFIKNFSILVPVDLVGQGARSSYADIVRYVAHEVQLTIKTSYAQTNLFNE